MTFFLPSSTSTPTTSLSPSPPPVLASLQDSEDESERGYNGAAFELRHGSDDISIARSGFTMFGLLSQRIEDYLSGESASEVSSLEDDSESEVESSWTRRATFGDDDDDRDSGDRDTNTRSPRSTREDARSPSRRQHGRSPQQSHEVVELQGRSVRVHQPRGTPESNVAFSTNQIEGEEAVRRRKRSRNRHDSTEIGQSARRETKLRHRRGHTSVVEALICTFQSYQLAPFIDFKKCFFNHSSSPLNFFSGSTFMQPGIFS